MFSCVQMVTVLVRVGEKDRGLKTPGRFIDILVAEISRGFFGRRNRGRNVPHCEGVESALFSCKRVQRKSSHHQPLQAFTKVRGFRSDGLFHTWVVRPH